MAFNVARYFEATGSFEVARRELDEVVSKAMKQTSAPCFVDITPATFECIQAQTFESIVQTLKGFFIEELKKQNATPT